MWANFNNPFAQLKKKLGRGKRKRRHIWQKFGFEEENHQTQDDQERWNNQDPNEEEQQNIWGDQSRWNFAKGFGQQIQNLAEGFGFGWGGQGQNNNFSNINMSDIGNIIQQQIIFVEPSPHQKRLEQLKENGQTFKDDLFPPTQSSLSGEWGHVSEWDSIQWLPVSENFSNPCIFQGKVEPGDIKQGYLGDCYFLAALAALAERQHRIKDLFLMKEINQQKYYSVKMLYKGKWMTIDMDEYVPFMYGQPAFTKSIKDQLWVVLLEKAWAKLYSNYKRIEAGYPEEGLHDLTGAPIKHIYMQHSSFDAQRQWQYLIRASAMQYSMVSSSQPGSDTTKSFSGVVQGHAYTFLNATTIECQGEQVRIVQLRNPWGKGQFKGDWSDGDQKWDFVDQSEKERVGYHPDANDGIFFMSWDDYCSQFRAMTVAQIDDDSSYIYKSHKDPDNKGCFFKIKIHQAGNYSFHIDKTPQRSYQDSKQQSFKYPLAQLEIGVFNGQQVYSKRGTSSYRRTLYYDLDLVPGEYIAFAKIHYDSYFEKDFDVNLAIYAQYACQIQLASHQQAVMFTGDQGVEWEGIDQEAKQWNNLKGWGQENNNNVNNWGNQGNNNNGWGNQGNNNNNDGWGNNGGNNNGWGNQGNDNGWGNKGNNNGWGNQGGNNGWGNEGNNNGWGNQGGNNGWGNNNGW